MADYTAKWRIQGENGMQAAFRSILGDAQATSNKMGAIFRTAFAGVSAAGLVIGLKNAAAEAIRFGDEIEKASKRTGLGAGEFASLAGAAKLAAVELATLSKGLRTLMVNTSQAATGNKTVTETFRALGISVEHFRALKPDDQLELLANQFVAMRDPADRARAGTQLFGRAWEDLAPFLLQGAEGLRAARKEFEALGGALSDEEIKKLADADAAIKRLDASWSGLARTLTAKASPALSGFFDILRRGFGGGTETELLREELTELNRLIDRMPDGVESKPINRNIIERRRIVEAQLAALGEYESRGPSRRRSFPGASTPAPGFQPDPPKPKTDKPVREVDELKGLRDAYASIYSDGVAAMRALETPHEAILRNFEEQKFALEQLAEIYPAFAGEADEAMARLVVTTDDQLEALKRIPIVAEEADSRMSVFAEQAARNMQSHFAEFFYSFDGGLKGMAAGFVDTLRRMAAELAAQQLLMSFFTWGANTFGGGVGSFFSGLAKGMRATGGDVKGGSPYWVGESGRRELFVPGVSGTIVPEGRLAGAGAGLTFNYSANIDARGASADMVKALPAILEQNRQAAADLAIAKWRNLNGQGRV